MRKSVVIASVVAAVLASFADTEDVDGVEWKFSGSDGKVTIEGVVGDLPNDGKLVVPQKLGGWNVSRILMSAFQYRKDLNSIEGVPSSVEWFEGIRFTDCSNLHTVRIRGSAMDGFVGPGMFVGCINLRTVELPSNTERIDGGAFDGCRSLEEIHLPKNLISINNGAFSGCYLLKNVVFPPKLKTIGWTAFYQCYSLDSIILPSSVETIEGAFAECVNLKSAVLQSSVKSIDRAFADCFRLETVVFLGPAPKGLPVDWFYGAKVFCYSEFSATYTNKNPNIVVRKPTAVLTELNGVTFTNAEQLVLLVDEKAALRAKANSKRWEELDAKANDAVVAAKMGLSVDEMKRAQREAVEREKRLEREGQTEREAAELRQKIEREKDAKLAAEKAAAEERARKRDAALAELVGWPRQMSAFETLSVYGTNIEEVLNTAGVGVSSRRIALGRTSVDMITECENHCPVTFSPNDDERYASWMAGSEKCLIDRYVNGVWDVEWKKYDTTGRLVKWAPCVSFDEYAWMTNQHTVISMRLREAWAKKHGMTVDGACKRAAELEVTVNGANTSPFRSPMSRMQSMRSRRQMRQQLAVQQQQVDANLKQQMEQMAALKAAEREEQRKQLLAIQEELRKAREAKRSAQ